MKLNKLIKYIICIALMMIMMPISTKAEDSRSSLETVTGNSVKVFDMTYKDLATYGNSIWDTANGNYINYYLRFSFDQTGLSCPDTMYRWEKKNSDGTWSKVTKGVFTEGIYRLAGQLRYNHPIYKLSDDTVVKIDGEQWTHSSAVGSEWDEISWFTMYSPEIIVTKQDNDLRFAESRLLDIPKSYVNKPIKTYSLVDYVSGGKQPYTFTKIDQMGYSQWINVSSDGVVSGTPEREAGASYFTVKVTDANGKYKTIDINFGDIYKDPNYRAEISKIEATSNINETLVYEQYAKTASFNVTEGNPVVFEPNPKFQKWNEETGEWKSCSILDYWMVTEGKYRVNTQVRIESSDVLNYKFADKENLSVIVDGVSWGIESVYNYTEGYCNAWIISPVFEVEKPSILFGLVTLSSAYYHNPVNPNLSSELVDLKNQDKLNYQWQRSTDGSIWENIEDNAANDRSYYPVEADVTNYIRVVISAEGYAGTVNSNGVLVGKALINTEKPIAPTLSYVYDAGSGATTVTVTNVQANQEYKLTYSSDSPDWSGALTSDNNTITFSGVGQNQTIFVHTRVKENAYRPASRISRYSTIFTGAPSSLVDFTLNYTNLTIQKDQVVALTATPIPAGATSYDGVKWYANGEQVKLYLDEACENEYVSGTLKTAVYLKGITQANGISVGAEKTISGSSSINRGISVNVTDDHGNYALDGLVLPEITIHAGGSTTVNVDTMPNPATVGTLSFEKTSGPKSELTLTSSDSKTITVNVPSDAATGEYYYEIKVDGNSTKITSAIKITVKNISDTIIPVESIELNNTDITLSPGDTVNLRATVYPANAIDKNVTWSISPENSKIGLDNSNGIINIADDAPEGTEAVITASVGGKTATCTLKIVYPTYSISVLGGNAYGGTTVIKNAKAGLLIDIVADTAVSGRKFEKWEIVEGSGFTLTDPNSSNTMFTMPKNDVVILASYIDAPKIIEGAGQTVKINSSDSALFVSNAKFSDFVGVKVDGKTLKEADFTAETGSIKVTLKKEFLSTLSEGTHILSILSGDDDATCTFSVEKAKPEETPKPTETPNPGSGNGGQSGSTGSGKNNVTSDGYVVPNTGVK